MNNLLLFTLRGGGNGSTRLILRQNALCRRACTAAVSSSASSSMIIPPKSSQKPILQDGYCRNYNTSSTTTSNTTIIIQSSLVESRTIPRQKRYSFHNSAIRLDDEKKEETEAQKGEEDDDDDPCPPWQNPLHHNNPEVQKMFPEDFAEGEEMKIQELPPFEDPNDPNKVLAPKHIEELANEVVHLSMLEMNELVNKIADHFGFLKPPFVGNDPNAVPGEGDDGDDDDGDEDGEGGKKEADEAKTTFDIKLTGFDAKSKIKVIKEVRALAGLGLKEAKEMVESAPKVIQKDIKKEAADEIKAKLEEVGATVEIV